MSLPFADKKSPPPEPTSPLPPKEFIETPPHVGATFHPIICVLMSLLCPSIIAGMVPVLIVIWFCGLTATDLPIWMLCKLSFTISSGLYIFGITAEALGYAWWRLSRWRMADETGSTDGQWYKLPVTKAYMCAVLGVREVHMWMHRKVILLVFGDRFGKLLHIESASGETKA